MNESFLDYLINLFSLLIIGAFIINGVAFLKWGYKKMRRSGVFIVFLLLAGCVNTSAPVDDTPAATPTPTTQPPVPLPSFDNTPEGLSSALTSGYPVLLVFTATWCPNCPEQEETIEGIRPDYQDLIIIYIDVDRYPDTADDYIVGFMPTTIIFNDKGEKITELIGPTPEDVLLDYLESL